MNSPTNEEIASEAFWGDAASVEEVCGKDAVERIKAALDEKDRIKDALLVQHDVWKRSSEELEKSLAQKDQLLREAEGALELAKESCERFDNEQKINIGYGLMGDIAVRSDRALRIVNEVLAKLKKELNP